MTLLLEDYLTTRDVAARYAESVAALRERTRRNAIPHLKLPGHRRCLFRLDHLTAWERGARLEVVELPDGGKLVKPIDEGAT